MATAGCNNRLTMHVALIACTMSMKAAESGVYPLENLSALQDLFEVC